MKLASLIAALGIAASASAIARAEEKTSPYVGVTAEQLYDSNVMNRYGDDGVTRVSPRVGLLVESERLRFISEYKLSLHTYDSGAADDSINHRGMLAINWKTTPRLTLAGDGVLLSGDDPVLLDRPGVIIPQGGFFDVQAHAGSAWRATRRTTLSLDYTARASRFDSVDVFDGDEHRVDGVAAWRATRRLTLLGIGRGQRFVTYSPAASLEGAVGAGGGLDYRLSRTWETRLQGGGLWFAGNPYIGWFARGDLTRTGQRWRVALRGLHDVFGGTSADEAVWSENVSLDGALRLTKTLGVTARGTLYRGGPAPRYDANVSGVIGRVALGWLAWRGALIDVYAEHRSQDAFGGRGLSDVDRTVAGVRLTATLGVDLRSLGETR